MTVTGWKRGAVAIVLSVLAGCYPSQPFYLQERGEMKHYLDKATQIEEPDAQQSGLAEAEQAKAPITLSDPNFDNFWDLTLEECVSLALNNSKIMRAGGTPRINQGIVTPGSFESSVTVSPAAFTTVYNPAIRESAPGGGEDGTGVEAALAAFDAQFRIFGDQGNNGLLSRTDRPQNVANTFNNFVLRNVQTNQGGVGASLTKRAATGTTFTANSFTDYSGGLRQGGGVQGLSTFWTQLLELRVDQPLLRGRGEQVNRIPVVIARINVDTELTNLEAQLQRMVTNVEIQYWNLYSAYRSLEAAKVGYNSTLITWRTTEKRQAGGVDSAQSLYQAQEQLYNFRAQLQQSFRDLVNAENTLRLFMGLAASDGRLIRPIQEPTLARVKYEWTEILNEGTVRRPEVRQKKWDIKRRELELILARNQLLPVLNVGALYRWVGLGDDLITSNSRGREFPQVGSSAWNDLVNGKYQEYGAFLDFQLPVGFRRELAGVTNAQLKLARELAYLEDIELDVSHSLAIGVRNLDANYHLAQTRFNQWEATQKEVDAAQAVYEKGVGQGRQPLDLLLDSQRRRSNAQNLYYQAIAEYNKAISFIHFQKGSILDFNGIQFEEGPWPKKAYWDALGRARERDASRYIDYGFTRPHVISRGPVDETSTPGTAGYSPNITDPNSVPITGDPSSEFIPSETPSATSPIKEKQPPTPAEDDTASMSPRYNSGGDNPLRSDAAGSGERNAMLNPTSRARGSGPFRFGESAWNGYAQNPKIDPTVSPASYREQMNRTSNEIGSNPANRQGPWAPSGR